MDQYDINRMAGILDGRMVGKHVSTALGDGVVVGVFVDMCGAEGCRGGELR